MTIPLLLSFALVISNWWIHVTFTPSTEVKGGLIFDTSTSAFVSPECFLEEHEQQQPFVGGVDNFKMKQEFLLVVSRPSTRRKKIQSSTPHPRCLCLDLGTRSLVSGVEL